MKSTNLILFQFADEVAKSMNGNFNIFNNTAQTKSEKKWKIDISNDCILKSFNDKVQELIDVLATAVKLIFNGHKLFFNKKGMSIELGLNNCGNVG